jgi:diguanylate cyclase (GGDEF)-like protein
LHAADSAAIENRACSFILSLQSTITVDKAWELLSLQFKKNYSLKKAKLTYKTGTLFKTLSHSNNKIIEKDVEEFQFLKSSKDFDCQLQGKTLHALKQEDGYIIQADLWFSDEITGESETGHLETLTHIFLNHTTLLLKIGNFEFHAIKDDITLAYNQKYLRAYIRNEIERCKRYPPSFFSLVFFDLDNLKAINEDHGHLIGTEVLKQVAAVLRQQVRKIDLLARFGGDEFVIILLKTKTDRAYDVCSRIKKNMEATTFLKDKNLNIKMTGCFGISSFPRDGDTVEELIRKADAAMYDVKHKGKNGIKIYEGD